MDARARARLPRRRLWLTPPPHTHTTPRHPPARAVVPEYKPEQSWTMFNAFINNVPLA